MSPKSRGRKKKPNRRVKPARRDNLRIVADFQGPEIEIPLRPRSLREQKLAAAQAKRAATADRDAEDRRAFAMPHRDAVVDGERYTDLDPADEEDLQLLILGEHPELQRFVADPTSDELVDGVNPRLHLAMLHIVITRLWNDEPKSTWREAKKLRAAGHSRTDILNALIEPVATEVWSALSPELGIMGQTPRDRGPRPGVSAMKNQDPSEVAFQVRVDILDARPPIWRRLILPATMTLAELHLTLQLAFDWTDSHLHSFTSGSRVIGNRHQLDDVEEETSVRLAEVLGRQGDRLDYEYDFGDSWRHRIVVEDVVPDAARTVRCTGGRQPAPPEDSGGVWAYGALLVAIKDPGHPDFHLAQEVLADAQEFVVANVDLRLGGVPVS